MKSPNNFLILLAIVVLVLTTFFQNCADFMDASHDAASNIDLSSKNLNGFKTSIFPILSQNCASCHATGVGPTFADSSNPEGGLQYLLDHFDNPLKPNTDLDPTKPAAQNGIVAKIQPGHNGFGAAMATQLQNAVSTWLSGIQ